MTRSGTNKNVYTVDPDYTNKCLTTHVTYDEAHMSSTKTDLPPMTITLRQRGHYPNPSSNGPSQNKPRFKLLSISATLLFRATPESAWYDLYSAENIAILNKTHQLISTDVLMELPNNLFGLLKSRIGLTLKHNIHIQAGVIDSDYRGEIKNLLTNDPHSDSHIPQGMRIAQLIIFELPKLNVEQTNMLSKIKATALTDSVFTDDSVVKYNDIYSENLFTDYGHLLKISNTTITSVDQVNILLDNITRKDKTFAIQVSQDQCNPIYLDNSLPMLYFDQLSARSKHLQHIKTTRIIKLDTSTNNQISIL